MIRLLGTAALAGVGSAFFAMIVADMLGLSKTITGVTSGLAMALLVGALIHRDGERPSNEKL